MNSHPWVMGLLVPLTLLFSHTPFGDLGPKSERESDLGPKPERSPTKARAGIRGNSARMLDGRELDGRPDVSEHWRLLQSCAFALGVG
jgi:hypothetical protein